MHLDRHHRRMNAGERATSHDRNRHWVLSLPNVDWFSCERPKPSNARQTHATTLAWRKQARLQPFGVARAVEALTGRWRRAETRLEIRDPRLELLELFARLQQHLGLRIEFRTRDNVELGETALQHRFHILL